MSESLGIALQISIPQLDTLQHHLTLLFDRLGVRMVDALDPIRASLDQLKETLNATLDTELTQISEALQSAAGQPQLDPDAILAIAENLDAVKDGLKARIAGIIPDAPAPEPAPSS